jgi:hypothetical protein
MARRIRSRIVIFFFSVFLFIFNFAGTTVGALHLSSNRFAEGSQRTLVVLDAEGGGFTAVLLSDSN